MWELMLTLMLVCVSTLIGFFLLASPKGAGFTILGLVAIVLYTLIYGKVDFHEQFFILLAFSYNLFLSLLVAIILLIIRLWGRSRDKLSKQSKTLPSNSSKVDSIGNN
jgi:hypothetical protein